ncbi:MAG: hypothetical protein ABEH43_05910 [Flavobacteriales bacterium]
MMKYINFFQKRPVFCTIILLGLFTLRCGNTGKNENGSKNKTEGGKYNSICIWQGTPVRKSPGKEGEWITNVNMGESFKYLDESKMGKA